MRLIHFVIILALGIHLFGFLRTNADRYPNTLRFAREFAQRVDAAYKEGLERGLEALERHLTPQRTKKAVAAGPAPAVADEGGQAAPPDGESRDMASRPSVETAEDGATGSGFVGGAGDAETGGDAEAVESLAEKLTNIVEALQEERPGTAR